MFAYARTVTSDHIFDCILTNKSVSPDDHFMMSMFMAEAFP